MVNMVSGYDYKFNFLNQVFQFEKTYCLFSLTSDSEMHAVYLKSVRSPAVRGKFKMSYRNHHNMDIFSQVYFIFKC